MSLLGKYRKEEERREVEDKDSVRTRKTTTQKRSAQTKTKSPDSIPNKERRSPIVSFSITTDLRTCLQAIRSTKAINLSMWVEHKLREAIEKEFPDLASEYL